MARAELLVAAVYDRRILLLEVSLRAVRDRRYRRRCRRHAFLTMRSSRDAGCAVSQELDPPLGSRHSDTLFFASPLFRRVRDEAFVCPFSRGRPARKQTADITTEQRVEREPEDLRMAVEGGLKSQRITDL
jgi:hypothetical protein